MAPTRNTRPSVAILGTRGYPSFYGGFETAVRYLAPYLVDQGWDVTVYGRDGDPTRNRVAPDHRVRVKMTHGIESKSLSTLSYGLTSAVAAARQRPDVALVMNCANGYFLPILKSAGVPTLVNVDGIEWERAKWGRAGKAVFKAGAQMTARFADEIVVDSKAIGDYWFRNFHRTSTFIPYGGEFREPLPPPRGLERRRYVLMVARLVPENSVSEFFDAVPRIAKRWPVVLVGSSGYGGDLDERAAAMDNSIENVTWMRHVSDDGLLHALWQNAGVYFHGHSVGGTNPALVQAMALGAPTVARDTVYAREVLADKGRFVRPTADGIERAVTSVMSADAQKASQGLIERARSHYSWETVCSEYEESLRVLVERVTK